MEELKALLAKYTDEKLILAVASNPAQKRDGLASKLKVRPVSVKGTVKFQATRTVGAQELHENNDAQATVSLILEMIENEPHFGQLELKNSEGTATVLISRKGRVTIKERRNPAADVRAEAGTELMCGISLPASVVGGPDRKKNYILQEGTPVPFLVELGVMNKDGYVVKARYDKFRQINRYLEFVDDIVPELGREAGNRRLEIIDFGCGKSYLTFALYHFLHESKGLNVHITGLDLKKDVIAHCGALARKLGYSDLEFKHGDIADYKTNGGVDMVVTLHACDTATDYALYNAVCWGAKVIFSVPCCQHELNGQIRNAELEPVLRYGILKERMSALITDAVRADILEEQGYRTQILEFIDMEHTPKNLLIRAVKKQSGSAGKNGRADGKQESLRDYERLLKDLGSELTLHRLFKAT